MAFVLLVEGNRNIPCLRTLGDFQFEVGKAVPAPDVIDHHNARSDYWNNLKYYCDFHSSEDASAAFDHFSALQGLAVHLLVNMPERPRTVYRCSVNGIDCSTCGTTFLPTSAGPTSFGAQPTGHAPPRSTSSATGSTTSSFSYASPQDTLMVPGPVTDSFGTTGHMPIIPGYLPAVNWSNTAYASPSGQLSVPYGAFSVAPLSHQAANGMRVPPPPDLYIRQPENSLFAISGGAAVTGIREVLFTKLPHRFALNTLNKLIKDVGGAEPQHLVYGKPRAGENGETAIGKFSTSQEAQSIANKLDGAKYNGIVIGAHLHVERTVVDEVPGSHSDPSGDSSRVVPAVSPSQGPPVPLPPSHGVCFLRMPLWITPLHLLEFIGRVAMVNPLEVPLVREVSESRAEGLAIFSTKEEAKRVVKALKRKRLNGSRMIVRLSKEG